MTEALVQPRCLACQAPISQDAEEEWGMCFECLDRAERAYQESGGTVWLPCTVCLSVQVAASDGFNTCIECEEADAEAHHGRAEG